MRIKWYVNTIVIGLFGNQILFWTIQYFDEISHKIENKIGNKSISRKKIFSIENVLPSHLLTLKDLCTGQWSGFQSNIHVREAFKKKE